MKKLIAIIIFNSILCFGYSQSTIDFITDLDIRVNGGTTRDAVYRNDSIYLYYGYNLWDGTNYTPTKGLAISDDSPDFNSFVLVNIEDYPLYNYTLLPDNLTRRKYGQQEGQNYLVSESSSDDWTATLDSETRYELDISDNGLFGVSTVVVDANADVHMYYMGDMSPTGINNIRHCMSIDGGDTLIFQSNDVCGDYSIGGQFSHLDPYAQLMDNNEIRLFTVNANGTIVPPNNTYNSKWVMHSFISSDHGMTFTQETTSSGNATIIYPSDFLDTNVRSVHDPKTVQLPDGRVKVFINGSTFDNTGNLHWDIYSAISCHDINTTEIQKTFNSGIPASYTFSVNHTPGAEYTWTMPDGSIIQGTNSVNYVIGSITGTTITVDISTECDSKTLSLEFSEEPDFFNSYIDIFGSNAFSKYYTHIKKVTVYDINMEEKFAFHIPVEYYLQNIPPFNHTIPAIPFPEGLYYVHYEDFVGNIYYKQFVKN